MESQNTSPDFERLRQLSDDGHLYFGYGSNLNAEDYAREGRRPLKFQCMAFGPDCSLRFDHDSKGRRGGVLSLGDMPGACIDGGLFAVEDWSELDRKEGVNRAAYVRICLYVLVPDARTGLCREVVAQTYVTANPAGFVTPGEEYQRICRRGREQLGLRTFDLDAAAEGKPNGFGHEPPGIFTYGTLCRGESRERVMRTGPPIDVAMAEVHGMSLWRHSSGQYPCLFEADPSVGHAQPVAGDFWTYRADGQNAESFSKLFPRLDAIESDARPMPRGIAEIAISKLAQGLSVDEASAETHTFVEAMVAYSLFRRTLVNVNFGGRNRLAWTYLYTGPKAGPLPIVSGNWRKYAGRWDGFLYTLAQSYIEKAGGLEAFRAQAAGNWKTSHLADIANVADIAQRLDNGQADERDLIARIGLSKSVE